jgi:hypothetical protein
MAALPFIAMAAQAAGAIAAGRAASVAGKAAEQGKEFEAVQMEQQAGQEMAAAQRSAQEEQRKARLVASRALAVASAGGGGASDPTVVRILADIDGEGAYRSAMELYRGEEAGRKLRMGAAGARYDGKVARAGGKAQATAQYLSAAGSLYTKYGDDAQYRAQLNDAAGQYGWDH